MLIKSQQHSNHIRKTADEIAVQSLAYVFMALLTVITLIPFLHVVSKAFSSEWAVTSGNVGILPIGFQIDSMAFVIRSKEFLVAFGNSIIVTVIGTLCALVITALTAYPLSKRNLPGMKGILLFFVFTMFFNGGMIPTYLVMKNLHLLNTRGILVLIALINVFHLLIIKNYYETLPESIEESAKMDGASNIVVFFKIIMPLSVPVYASIAVFTSVMQWNNYLNAMLYLNSPSLKTLPLYLSDMIAEAQDTVNMANNLGNISPDGVIAAAIVASTVPILCIYPFMQKYFIKGMTVGSVKG